MAGEGIDWAVVLKKIKPDEKQVWKSVHHFLAKIDARVKKTDLQITLLPGGSLAKGTFLKDAHDVDVFVRFDPLYPSEKLADLFEQCLKGLKYERIHGSRDYFKIKEGKLVFEFVPVYKITSVHEAKNITDASPLHVAWVQEQIQKKTKLADSIRLAKAFCKAQGVYGAESYIRGFSGHVLDILTSYYGGFASLLKAATEWRAKKIIDFYNFHKGRVLKNMNKAKIESPLILIDPIDPYRNAAASLSDEKFHLFIEKAKAFLAQPDSSFFLQKSATYAGLKKEAGKNVFSYLEATSLPGKEDVEGAKLLKVFEYIRNQLVLHGFFITTANWKWDKKKNAAFWFFVNVKELEKTFAWEGPKVSDEQNVLLFKQKHTHTFEKDERIYATVERAFTKPREFIKHLIKQPYVIEKVKKITLKSA